MSRGVRCTRGRSERGDAARPRLLLVLPFQIVLQVRLLRIEAAGGTAWPIAAIIRCAAGDTTAVLVTTPDDVRTKERRYLWRQVLSRDIPTRCSRAALLVAASG